MVSEVPVPRSFLPAPAARILACGLHPSLSSAGVVPAPLPLLAVHVATHQPRHKVRSMNTIREYPVKWGALSNLLGIPAALGFLDVVITRMDTGEVPSASLLAAASLAGLLAGLRALQHYWKSKDPAMVPTVYPGY